MDAAVVGVDTRRLVADLRAVLPAVPEPDRHVGELRGPPVALPVRRVVVEPEVQRGVSPGRGDDVPAGPATADVVQRGEPAGQVVGLVVGGRRGGDEPDPAGHPGQRGEQHGRLERAARTVPGVPPQRGPVGQEDRVEGTALGDLGQVRPVPDVEAGERVAAGKPPRRLVVPAAHQERVEVELPFRTGHTRLPPVPARPRLAPTPRAGAARAARPRRTSTPPPGAGTRTG
jgi:hypothetical protein